MVQTRDTKGRYTGNGQKPRMSEEQFIDRLMNATFSRAQFARQSFSSRKDINVECEYPLTDEMTALRYKDLYDREPVATRVVQVFPRECWQVQPTVQEDENPDKETEFEKAWMDLGTDLKEESTYRSKTAHPLWEYLLRVDELSGIGRYGILLFGLDDGKELNEPIEKGSANRKLLYVRCFDESSARIVQTDEDVNSPRCGQPIMYDVDLIMGTTGGVSRISTKNVHWTRTVHIADDLGTSEVFGVPRIQPVLNPILDVRKVRGGSAEMYWSGAFPGLSLESHPQMGSDVILPKEEMQQMMERYGSSLQRWITLAGASAHSLAPQVVDPTPQIDAQITAICIQKGIPKRVFMGSEIGQLSSEQDTLRWIGRLMFRQQIYLTPRVVVRAIDKLIWLGVLPKPTEYNITWPKIDTLTAQGQADVAFKLTEAMTKYATGDGESIMHLEDFFIRILGLDEKVVMGILDKVGEREDSSEEEKFTHSEAEDELQDMKDKEEEKVTVRELSEGNKVTKRAIVGK